jgi:DNA-binding XRE family transcriptional regulator
VAYNGYIGTWEAGELNKLGSRIKSLRELNQMTQRELAKKLNISNTTQRSYLIGWDIPI